MSDLVLTPREYGCKLHGRNLTGAVTGKVAADPTVVTSLGFRRSSRLPAMPAAFAVDVICPGDDQQTGSHTKRFRGSYRVVPQGDERGADPRR